MVQAFQIASSEPPLEDQLGSRAFVQPVKKFEVRAIPKCARVFLRVIQTRMCAKNEAIFALDKTRPDVA